MVILSQGTFSFAGARGYAQQLVYTVDLLRKGFIFKQCGGFNPILNKSIVSSELKFSSNTER